MDNVVHDLVRPPHSKQIHATVIIVDCAVLSEIVIPRIVKSEPIATVSASSVVDQALRRGTNHEETLLSTAIREIIPQGIVIC